MLGFKEAQHKITHNPKKHMVNDMTEQVKRTPEELKALRVENMARARAAKKPSAETNTVIAKTVYFDTAYHDYHNFVEGLKLAMKNLDVRAKNDVTKCIPLAEEFVRVCQTKYPS